MVLDWFYKLEHFKSMPTFEIKGLLSSSHLHTLDQTLITHIEKKRDINPSRRYVLISTAIPRPSEETVRRKDDGRGGEREGERNKYTLT